MIFLIKFSLFYIIKLKVAIFILKEKRIFEQKAIKKMLEEDNNREKKRNKWKDKGVRRDISETIGIISEWK